MTLSVATTSGRRTAGSIEVIPTGAALGAEVMGVDLRHLDETTFGRLVQAWHDHSVVLVRDQRLSDQDLIAFSRRLGDLDWAPIQETGRRFVEGLPEIYIVSNVKVNGEPIGSLGDGEAVWHTDMSYLDVPPKASMLYALEVPPTGGNTSFCTMYGVYESLPQWHKPVGYFLIQGSGYPNYAGVLAIRPADKEKLAPCLRQLVPVIQQAQIDMMTNPGPAEQKIVKSVADFKSIFQYSAQNAQFGMCQIAHESLVSNPPAGPLGTMQPDKVRRVVDVLRPILTAQQTDIPADLTADKLATNEYLDKTKRLPSAAPSWTSSCPSRSR